MLAGFRQSGGVPCVRQQPVDFWTASGRDLASCSVTTTMWLIGTTLCWAYHLRAAVSEQRIELLTVGHRGRSAR